MPCGHLELCSKIYKAAQAGLNSILYTPINQYLKHTRNKLHRIVMNLFNLDISARGIPLAEICACPQLVGGFHKPSCKAALRPQFIGGLYAIIPLPPIL